MSSIVMKNCWLSAEKTCFTELLKATGSKENVDAYRGGYLPEDRESWSFNTGGNAIEPMSRFWGASPAWCAIGMNAEIITRFAKRDDCLEFAGKILNFLQEKTNLRNIGNIIEFRLDNLPLPPEPVEISNGIIVWVMRIPMQMIFATEQDT